MTARDRRLAPAVLALAASALLGPPASAGAVSVQIKLPIPQKIDVTGMRRVLVGGFRANDNPDIDIDKEYIKYTKEMLRKRSTFEIIDVDPPPLPEQELKDIVKNASYWKRIAQRYSADLIIAGTVDFERTDQSGFIQEDVISPYTGQRMRRTRYAEREGFQLSTRLYYFKGSSGELLYEQKLSEEAIFEGSGNDGLSALDQLAERSSPEVLGVIMPQRKTESRYLFTE